MNSRTVRTNDLQPGQVVSVQLNDKTIAVANVAGNYLAFDAICTHRGCSLAEGRLEGNAVICTCHGSQFDMRTGEVLHGPASRNLDVYAVRIQGEVLEVVMPDEAIRNDVELPTAGTSEPSSVQQSLLASIPLFSGMDSAALAGLEAFAFRRPFSAGDLIVEEGRTGNGLYVVLSGHVEVTKGLDADTKESLAVLGPGEPFGEMALLGEWKRSASVCAIDDVECLGLDRWVFLDYLTREPTFAIRLLQVFAQRLAETGGRLVE